MNYEILTDRCCDYPQYLYRELGLHSVPLTLMYKGESLEDLSDASLKDMYDGLRGGAVATTSAANPERWASAMKPILEQGQDILVLAFSSGLSTTYQSAVIAAGELSRKYPQRTIRVVDTLSASMGQGLLVWYACRHRTAGMPLAELATWVEENRLHLCHWFTVDDLMYLKRGGRISAGTALLGTMLNIKPVLHMDNEGHLVSVSKARGRKAAIDALAHRMASLGEGYDNAVAFISHGDCPEDAAYLAQQIREKCGVQEVITSYVGAVIGSHAGPGTLALFFLGKER